MSKWRQGVVLMTPTTKKWSVKELDDANYIEENQIYSNFHAHDLGKSRQLVCSVDRYHQSYLSNLALIKNSPEMFEMLKECRDHLVMVQLIDKSNQTITLLNKVEDLLVKCGWKQP